MICVLALWLSACTSPQQPAPAPPEQSGITTGVVAATTAPSPSPSQSASAATAALVRREGSYEGGTYRYAVPPDWNGGLVMYAHGIQQGFGPTVQEPPLSSHILSKGYAWAASSYRDREYVPHLGIEDTLALKRLFVREVGRPRWTIIYGQSMGGQITTASLETYPDEYQAGLAECGLVDGVWEVEYVLSYTAVAELLSSVPLLDAPDRNTLARRAGEQWIPIMGTPGAYTEKGKAFDSVVKYLMGGDLPYRIEGLKPRFLLNLNRYEDPTTTQSPSLPYADTRTIVYQIDPGLGMTADELNMRVRRFTPATGGRDPARDAAFGERSGKLPGPLLTLHTTGDGWVPFSHEQRYRRRTIAAGTEHLLVQRAIRRPSHCDFNSDERVLAFDDLVTWLETGARPDGDDVLAPDLSQIGVRWTKPLYVDDPAARR